MTKNKISRKVKNSINHDDVYDSKNSIWTEFKLIVIKIYGGPSINIGNSGVKFEGVFSVLGDVDIDMIGKIAGTLKYIFTGSSNKKKSE